MSAASLKTAARYVGRWSAIVFFVVLLTLIFSFLGTIICAVLAGMMFGATKHVRWQALLISLIFPGAIFGLLRAGRAPLLERQVLVLSLLCFGAFWLTYVIAAAVIYFERSAPASVPPERLATAEPVVPPPVVLNLHELEGTWSGPICGRNGESRAKELEINPRELVLRLRDAQGHVSTVGKAELRFEESRRVRLSALPEPDDTLVCI